MKHLILIIMLFAIACGGEDTDELLEDAGADSGEEDEDTEPDLCDEVLCDSPPASICLNEKDLQFYTKDAFCFDGECYYSYQILECLVACQTIDGLDQCTNG